MKNKSFVYILLCTLFLATSCAKAELSAKEISFRGLVPIRDLNDSVILGRHPVFENGDSNEKLPEASESFNVYLINNSSDDYSFPASENPYIYYYAEQEDQWIEIGELYHGDVDLTLLAETESREFSVAPCFLQVTHPTEIRLAMLGYRIENHQRTDSMVGAYLDVTIQPRETCDQGFCISLAIDHDLTSPDRIQTTTTVITPLPRDDFEVFIGTNDSTAVIEAIDQAIVQWNGFEGQIWYVDTLANTPVSILTTITFTALGQKTIYASVYPSSGDVILASDFLIYDYDEEGGRVITSCSEVEFP